MRNRYNYSWFHRDGTSKIHPNLACGGPVARFRSVNLSPNPNVARDSMHTLFGAEFTEAISRKELAGKR